MDPIYEKEIVELHDFFQDWFNAVLPQNQEAFNRMDRVIDRRFAIVMPSGVRVEREVLLARLFGAHGARSGIRIWIERVSVLIETDDLAVVEYEEWQEEGGEVTSRYSTVVFRRQQNVPNKLVWVHVHETWFTRS